MAAEADVNDTVLPRKRKVPQRYDDGSAPPEFHSTPKDFYRQTQYEALDLIVQSISDRFNQPGYKTYCCLEALILKAIKKEDFSEELETILDADINASNLKQQLEILSANVESETITDIVDVKKHLQQMTGTERVLINEVVLLMKLIPVSPAYNATSERSFSAMRRVKSCLRSIMTQERLNHLMLLHIHRLNRFLGIN